MNSILSASEIEKRFAGDEVLRGVSFELAPDSVTVLLGTNGAGKSTLLRCVLGLLSPDGGEIRVCGRDPLQEPQAVRGDVGYVPDQPDAYPWMCARDLFRFLRGQTPRWSDERAVSLIERIGAPLDTRFGAMSRGEAAKVMLAAALAPAPPLVLLDEPFARLAPPVREDVLSLFLEEVPARGGAAIIATHDLDVAARVADRVLVLDGGRLIEDIDVLDLPSSPEGRSGLPQALRLLYPEGKMRELAR